MLILKDCVPGVGWDRRGEKVIVGKVKPLEVNKAKKATSGANITR